MAFSQNMVLGIGLQICAGVLILAAVLALAARAFSKRRGSNPKNRNMWTDPGSNRLPAVDGVDYKLEDDFGGVPTTGSVQEYERDTDDGDIIGSSGFENRVSGDDESQDSPPPEGKPRFQG